jgi:hypothetical protein
VHPEHPAGAPGASFWRRLYLGWLAIAARFGEAQTLVVLTLVYTLVIGPVALGIAVARRDLLHKRDLGGAGSAWSEADTESKPDVERAKRLF